MESKSMKGAAQHSSNYFQKNIFQKNITESLDFPLETYAKSHKVST